VSVQSTRDLKPSMGNTTVSRHLRGRLRNALSQTFASIPRSTFTILTILHAMLKCCAGGAIINSTTLTRLTLLASVTRSWRANVIGLYSSGPRSEDNCRNKRCSYPSFRHCSRQELTFVRKTCGLMAMTR